MRFFVVLVLIAAAGTRAFADEPFDAAVLAKAFELGKTCSKECANESVDLVRLVLPKGNVGFLITTRNMNFCGSHGCSSLVVSVGDNKFVVVKDGQGITEQEAVLAFESGPPTTYEKPSFDCSKARSAGARLICSDPELTNLDGQLGAVFQRARSNFEGADRENFVRAQLNWIRGRNANCNITGKDNAPIADLKLAKQCIAQAINKRIAELNGNAGFGSPNPNSEPEKLPSVQTATNQKLTQGELSTFRDALSKNWFPPDLVNVPAGTDVGVVLRMKLNRDGSLNGEPVLVQAPAIPAGPALAESARQAIVRSAPFRGFRQESYDAWKDIEFRFEPKGTNGQLVAQATPPEMAAPSQNDFANVKITQFSCHEGFGDAGVLTIDSKSVDDAWVSTREALATFSEFAVDLLYTKCGGNPGRRLRVVIYGPHRNCNGACTLLSLENRDAMLNGYGQIMPGFSYSLRGQEWYAPDQDNAYWGWEKEIIAQRQQAQQQNLDAAQAQELRASVGNKTDIVGFSTGGAIDSVEEASRLCTQLQTGGGTIKYKCPQGELTLFQAEYLNPPLIAIVRLNFCDPKDGTAVAAQVAQQFGILHFPWIVGTGGQAAKGPLDSGKHLELFLDLALVPVPGSSTNCPANYNPYFIQVVDDGVIERNVQAKTAADRELKSRPTEKF